MHTEEPFVSWVVVFFFFFFLEGEGWKGGGGGGGGCSFEVSSKVKFVDEKIKWEQEKFKTFMMRLGTEVKGIIRSIF